MFLGSLGPGLTNGSNSIELELLVCQVVMARILSMNSLVVKLLSLTTGLLKSRDGTINKTLLECMRSV